jgi:hypothetical protein
VSPPNSNSPVSRWTKLSAKAATPLTDETNAFTTDEPEGKLGNIALKVLMEIL